VKKQLIIPPGQPLVRQVSGQLETEVLSLKHHDGVMLSSIRYLIHCIDFSKPFEGDEFGSYTTTDNELFKLQPIFYTDNEDYNHEPFFHHKNTRLRIYGDDGFLKKNRITKVENPTDITIRQFLKIIGDCAQYAREHPEEKLNLIEFKS